MAKERNLIAIVFKNFFKSLLPRKFSGELRGSDHMGNKYYEISSLNRNKASRYFTPIGGEAGFDNEIPAEWEAWLRGRRSQPPTETEVLSNYRLMLEKKKNAAEIDTKFKGVTEENLLPPDMKGMRSFPKYNDYEVMPGKKVDKEDK